MILGMVVWLVLIIGIVLLVVWAIRRNNRGPVSVSSNAVPGQPSALDILQARYARGEITKEQYDAMKRDIS